MNQEKQNISDETESDENFEELLNQHQMVSFDLNPGDQVIF